MNTIFKAAMAAAALACATTALADTVEMVFDVTAVTKAFSLDALNTFTPAEGSVDATFQPESFQWTVSFELGQALQDKKALDTTPGLQTSIRTLLSTTSATPFTTSLNTPLDGTTIDASELQGTSIYLSQWTTETPEHIDLQISPGYSKFQSAVEQDGTLTLQTYGRTLYWVQPGLSTDESARALAWTSQDVADYFASHVGDSRPHFIDEFRDQSKYVIQNDGSLARTSSDAIYIRSMATLRSVTIVPEPGTWALMGLGLAAIGLKRRQRSR